MCFWQTCSVHIEMSNAVGRNEKIYKKILLLFVGLLGKFWGL